MKRILLTGSNGFLGRQVVDLSSSEDQIYQLDAMPSQRDTDKFFQIDLSNRKSVESLDFQCDGIIHLAGVSRVRDGEADPVRCFETNLIGSLNIFEFARRSNPSPWIVLGSSVELPINVYGLSKNQAEQCAELYGKKYGLNIFSLRFSNIFGSPNDNPKKLIPILIAQALKGAKITINNPEQLINIIPVRDVARGVWLASEYLSKRKCGFKVCDLCSEQSVKLEDLARRIVELAESKSVIDCLQTTQLAEKSELATSIPNPRDAYETLGFSVESTLDDQLIDALNAYQEQTSG